MFAVHTLARSLFRPLLPHTLYPPQFLNVRVKSIKSIKNADSNNETSLNAHEAKLLEGVRAAQCDGIKASCEDGHWYIDVTARRDRAQHHEPSDRVRNLTAIIDGYFKQGGQHININVLTREKLLDAMEHPEAYPGLTIRVSGYAVRFDRLSREQQQEVILRTFHDTM